jgi:hypothetical protein
LYKTKVEFSFIFKERANLTDRDMLPRSVGYREIGPVPVGEGRVATMAELAAAAAIVAGPVPPVRPLFSLDSEESLVSSKSGSERAARRPSFYNFFDWAPAESIELTTFRHSAYPPGPAILPVDSFETVDLADRK